jgi:hypothetical protein
MSTTPTPITLTAQLESILATSSEGGYLRITLCGYGPVCPSVPGVGMLADAGVPQYEGPQGTTELSLMLYGNDVIQPAGTFYEIAVLDANKDVVQANNYNLTGSGTFDLSTLIPIVGPLGFLMTFLHYTQCSGSLVGGNQTFTAPGNIIAASYNGILMNSTQCTIAGNTVTLTFNPEPGDRIDAFCIF